MRIEPLDKQPQKSIKVESKKRPNTSFSDVLKEVLEKKEIAKAQNISNPREKETVDTKPLFNMFFKLEEYQKILSDPSVPLSVLYEKLSEMVIEESRMPTYTEKILKEISNKLSFLIEKEKARIEKGYYL